VVAYAWLRCTGFKEEKEKTTNRYERIMKFGGGQRTKTYFGWTKAYFTDTDQFDCNIISRDYSNFLIGKGKIIGKFGTDLKDTD
jgi:hypothetical protein